jgi:hypothetical protein
LGVRSHRFLLDFVCSLAAESILKLKSPLLELSVLNHMGQFRALIFQKLCTASDEVEIHSIKG